MDPQNDTPQICKGCGAPMEYTDHTLCPSCVEIENGRGRKPYPPVVVHDHVEEDSPASPLRASVIGGGDPDGPLMGCVILALMLVVGVLLGVIVVLVFT